MMITILRYVHDYILTDIEFICEYKYLIMYLRNSHAVSFNL
jgi:hypothetical protein